VRQARGCPSGIRTMTAIKIVSISLLLHAIYPGGNCASVQYCSQVWSALLIMTRPRSRGGTAATALQRVLVDVEHDPAEDRQRREPGLLLPPSDRRLCNFGIFWLGGDLCRPKPYCKYRRDQHATGLVGRSRHDESRPRGRRNTSLATPCGHLLDLVGSRVIARRIYLIVERST
jgi:hypothetical protein